MPLSDDPRAEARAILEKVAALRRDVAEAGARTAGAWRSHIARGAFAPDALNLASYLAFRRHDLRSLQRSLMVLGVSSLGRLESRVLASLDAVTVALSALAQTKAVVDSPPSARR